MDEALNCTHPLASAVGNVSTPELLSLLRKEELQEFMFKLPTFLLLILYVILGIPGNAIVIVVYYFRFRASTTKTFILSLSTIDLINCFIGLPFEMVDLRYDIELDLPVLCKVLRFVVTFCSSGSTLVLLSVAVDRFRRICQPFKRQMSVKQSKYVVIAMVLISIAISAPALILYGSRTTVYRDVSMTDCTINDMWANSGFAIGNQMILGLLWVLSILILCIMYGVIIYKIRKQEVRRLNLTSNSFASLAFSKFNSTASVHNTRKISAGSCDRELLKERLDGKQPVRNQVQMCPSGADPPCVVSSADNKNVSPSISGRENGQRQHNYLNRLFSRDVNPIYEEEDEPKKISSPSLEDIHEGNFENFAKNNSEEVITTSNYGIKDSPTKISITVDSVDNTNSQSSPERNSDNHATDDGEDCGLDDLSKRRTSSVPCVTDNLDRGRKSHTSSERSSPQMFETKTYNRSNSLPASSETLNNWSSAKHKSEGCKILNGVITSIQSGHKNSIPERKNSNGQYYSGRGESLNQRISGDNTDISDNNSQRLNVLGRGYVSDDRSLDRITSTSDRTNGSILTLNDSKVTSNRRSTPSRAASIVRQVSINSHDGSSSCEVKRRSKTSLSSQGSFSAGRTHKTSVTSMGGHGRLNHSVVSSSRELKSSRIAVMMCHVTLGHVLSYLPHLAIQFHRVIGPSNIAWLLCHHVYFAFHHILLRSIFLNSTINPFIYSYNNRQFRMYCKSLLTRPLAFCRRKKSSHTIDSMHSVSMD